PTMLTSGDHAAIDRWRRDSSLRRTSQMRPDLIRHMDPRTLAEADLAVLASCGWVIIDGQFSLDQPTVAD
ncbi:MAG: tRNA (guanosine(37)-N1)-methyltransferase TrmD, partial [Candidatus Nanopelagicales bacterium]